MFYVSEIKTEAPENFSTPLQEKIYKSLGDLHISFERVDTDPGITMEDCQNINGGIGGRIVKTVFLCNRQQTKFYVYAMRDDKPFVTRDFGAALGIPRVSFGSAELLMEVAGVEHGATTILCACLDSDKDVTFVVDREIIEAESFCCTDGTATCFIKLVPKDITDKFFPAFGKKLTII
jgi:Ala-tRNA(Pro) deacylase